ncbi:MAG: acetyl-CoA carboxylase biotin carboxyl carrier protein subunit [Chloroflexota bacterium]
MTEPRSGAGAERSRAGEIQALAELSDDLLPALIARLRASGLGELEIRTDAWRVRLRRETAPADGSMRATAGTSAGAAGGGAGAVDEAAGVARSPAVGYFSPGDDVAVGRSVRSGDSLGNVDVLGIIQDVAAPIGGVISRVLAEPGQAVEYGQALAEIEAIGADPTPRSS